MVTETAMSVLSPKKKVHQDWFDESDEAVQALLDERRKAFIDWQNHPNCSSRHDRYKDCKARAQQELRNMQNQWWERKADEVQLYADSNNSKMLFSAIKAIFGPSASGQPLCSLLTVLPSSRTKRESVRGGRSTSVSYSTGHLLSTRFC